MTDPTPPNRPDHPDFWLMSEVVIDLDAASEDGVPFEEIISGVDKQSLGYMAQQRARHAGKLLAEPVPREIQAATAWVDGFMAGVRFHALKQERGEGSDS